MKVAIIGAGVAGMTLAKNLIQRGAQIEVFEKSRGLGGRLTTKRFHWGHVDIGAQYFTARDPRFQKQVDQWQTDKLVALWPFTPYICSPSGLVASPDDTARYVGTPGMNSVVHALVGETQTTDLDIHYRTGIKSLRRHADKWTLLTEDNKSFGTYDWTVLSLPAEQSVFLLKNLGLGDSLKKVVHEPCWALALATSGEVAPKIQGFFGDDVVSWVSRLSARPQRHTHKDHDDLWMLHLSREWSEANGKDTSINIVQTGMQWLESTLGEHAPNPLKLEHSYTHYWRYANCKSVQNDSTIFVNKSSQIAAIGAWAAGDKVEGAFLSAHNLIDNCFNNYYGSDLSA